MRRRPHLRRWVIGLVVIGSATAALTWWLSRSDGPAPELTLYGNIDQREVSLAFTDSERVADVLVEEGDRVRPGDPLARLQTDRLELLIAQAQHQVDAQVAMVDRLRNGSRPEEIDRARANVAAAAAQAENADLQYERVSALLASSGVSQQDVDRAKAAMDVADAQLAASQDALDLVMAGARAEDVAQAEAARGVSEAQLGLLHQQLDDATLVSPVGGVVRSRLVEPGEIASPQRPVVTIAVEDPKWVRAYVAETDLPQVQPGTKAYVTADGVDGRRFDGWIGFVSSVAEFTPKTIQTEALRTSLVYEVRVFVEDPSDELRMGMPVTVVLPSDTSATAPAATPATTPPP